MAGVRLMSFADTPEREAWRTELARLEDNLKHLNAALIQAQGSGASRRTLALRRENWRVRHRIVQLREFLGLPVPADESLEPTRAYARLGAYLAARPPGETRVMLGFGQVETLLASPLPSAARQKRRLTQSTWWRGNARQAYAWRGWLQVGWHVERVDRAAETVTFARTGEADDHQRLIVPVARLVQDRHRQLIGRGGSFGLVEGVQQPDGQRGAVLDFQGQPGVRNVGGVPRSRPLTGTHLPPGATPRGARWPANACPAALTPRS